MQAAIISAAMAIVLAPSRSCRVNVTVAQRLMGSVSVMATVV